MVVVVVAVVVVVVDVETLVMHFDFESHEVHVVKLMVFLVDVHLIFDAIYQMLLVVPKNIKNSKHLKL